MKMKKGLHEYSQIFIKTVENNEKMRKIRRYTYKSNIISIAECPRVPNYVLNLCQDIIMFTK